jgi:hypothetical protein
MSLSCINHHQKNYTNPSVSRTYESPPWSCNQERWSNNWELSYMGSVSLFLDVAHDNMIAFGSKCCWHGAPKCIICCTSWHVPDPWARSMQKLTTSELKPLQHLVLMPGLHLSKHLLGCSSQLQPICHMVKALCKHPLSQFLQMVQIDNP